MWWNVVNIFSGFRTSKSIRKCIKKTHRPYSFLHADLWIVVWYCWFKNTLNSCLTQGQIKGWDVMKPLFIEGLRIARMPADHAWRAVIGADEMNEVSVEKWWNDICGRGNGRNPEKNPPRLSFVHHETHIEWPRRELWTPAVGAQHLTVWSMESPRMVLYFI